MVSIREEAVRRLQPGSLKGFCQVPGEKQKADWPATLCGETVCVCCVFEYLMFGFRASHVHKRPIN